MVKMIKKVFLGIGSIIIILIMYTATLPSNYTISSETVIHKAPNQVFGLLNSSEKNNDWMPWKASDPEMQMKYEGPVSGVGSKATWNSKGSMGVGYSEIIESIPYQFVKFKLVYLEPMAMQQTATLQVLAQDTSSKVIWSVQGENPFIGRLFFKLLGIERQVSTEFAKGLLSLKAMVEKN